MLQDVVGSTFTKGDDDFLELDAHVGRRDGGSRRFDCVTGDEATDDDVVLDDFVVFTLLNAGKVVLELDAEVGGGYAGEGGAEVAHSGFASLVVRG